MDALESNTLFSSVLNKPMGMLPHVLYEPDEETTGAAIGYNLLVANKKK